MQQKTTFSIYQSHGDGFSHPDLEKLSSALTQATGKEIKIKSDVTPDGEELLFILES